MDNSLNPAIYAALLAFGVNIVLCPFFIPFLHKLKFGQFVRDDGPQTHLKKAGTPTMGGIMIVISFLAGAALYLKGNPEATAVVLVTLGFGVIGFMDDYVKVVKKRSLGLRAWQKMLAQFIVATLFVKYMVKNPTGYFGVPANGTFIPFLGVSLNLGVLYIPFLYFIMIGSTNGVNLTDGLDGLAAGVTALVATFFVFMAYMAGSPLLPAVGAAAGSLLGFLLFNSHPARIIMGDTGSLALGGFVASSAIILNIPIVLAIVGIIYVAEVLSDIIQVGYFKLTHGKRIFKMAPLHHHFELSGYSETKIVAVFYVVTTIMCLVAYLGMQAV